MNTSLVPVPFHGTTLFLLEQNNEPYTPMKPIVEGMGLAWQVQHRKLDSNKERWGITMMVIPSKSGEQETLCMPLRKLPGWLQTIQPSRVKPEIREKILQYQNECDDALWKYWTQGAAINLRVIEDPDARLRRIREGNRIRQTRFRAKIAEKLAEVDHARTLDLNFPKGTATPEKPFWKESPPDWGGDSLSVQDLLGKNYPDPLRQAIERIEKAGYDVEGLWVQYHALYHHLRANSDILTKIYDMSRARRTP